MITQIEEVRVKWISTVSANEFKLFFAKDKVPWARTRRPIMGHSTKAIAINGTM